MPFRITCGINKMIRNHTEQDLFSQLFRISTVHLRYAALHSAALIYFATESHCPHTHTYAGDITFKRGNSFFSKSSEGKIRFGGEIKWWKKMEQIVQPYNLKLNGGSSGDILLRGLTLSLSALTMCWLFHLVNKCLRSKGFPIVVMLTLESEATPLAFEGAKY